MSPVRQAMEYHYSNGERQTWLIGKWNSRYLKTIISKTEGTVLIVLSLF